MKLYKINNAVLLKKGGSLIFCNDCNRIVGSINENAYSYININFDCSCNTMVRHSVEIMKKEYTLKNVGNAPKLSAFGLYSCKKCNTPLLSIVKDRVTSFSFHVKCSCGEIYDKKDVVEKRLGETLDRIKKMSAN